MSRKAGKMEADYIPNKSMTLIVFPHRYARQEGRGCDLETKILGTLHCALAPEHFGIDEGNAWGCPGFRPVSGTQFWWGRIGFCYYRVLRYLNWG